MDDKYSQELKKNVSKLDALSDSEGALTQCAIEITESQDEDATIELCKRLSELITQDDDKLKKMAKAVNINLVQYYGRLRLKEICNKDIVTEEEEKSLPELMDELNELVGLEKVKAQVNDLIAYQKVQKLRKEHGLNSEKSTLHLAFTGNPGTGKTTVARIVGRIYKQIGLLSKGHFLEVSRTDLIAGYQGQTAIKVKTVIEKAKGGVLFIDEAYSITENDHTDSYGRECLTELTKALEDYREDLVVIVAGYTEPMNKFFQSNPGLKSRFNTFIEFDDYNQVELKNILDQMCIKNNYCLTEEASCKMDEILSHEVANKGEQFANGRLVRNFYEDLVMNHARRVSMMDAPTLDDLKDIVIEDVNALRV